MRSIRNQPFCWQDKDILRLINRYYQHDKSKLLKMRGLYFTLTEIEYDFDNYDVQFFTKIISDYSGLSEDFIPKAFKELDELIKSHERGSL